MRAPSRTRRGNMLKEEIKAIQKETSWGMPGIKTSKDMGKNGKRMDFSWTWYENMKKANAQLARERTKFRGSGDRKRQWMQAGEIARRVEKRAIKKAKDLSNMCWTLTKRDKVHQKLATLSSNRPRATGKRRWSTTVGEKGNQRRAKVETTTIPRHSTFQNAADQEDRKRKR